MIALRRAMRETPMASVTVTAAGSPSGMAATASAIAARTVSKNGCPRADPDDTASTAMARMTTSSTCEKEAIFARERRLDFPGRGDQLRNLPDLGGVAGGRHQGARLTGDNERRGVDHGSPVRQERRFGKLDGCFLVHRRRFAGEGRLGHDAGRVPASAGRRPGSCPRPASMIRSPGTSSCAGIGTGLPPRTTTACATIVSASDSIARSARDSCRKP